MDILTAQAQALPLALAEAGSPRVLSQLMPGVALCEAAVLEKPPVFLRHICPAQASVPLTGETGDLAMLAGALRGLLPSLNAQNSFSVQTRIIDGFTPAYKRFDVNAALCVIAQETGAQLDVKAPAQAISVTLAEGAGYIGISPVSENLSDWAGGARRYKWEEGQVSRAEFKLLEAIDTFHIPLSDGARALDLGAAPGGWTRILRRRGLFVAAVDPATLDPRIAKDKRVTHFRETAQAYFRHAEAFDIMVNDMKMDSAASCALMAEGARCLLPGGRAVLTLKLPDKCEEWLPRVSQAEAILRDAYSIIGMRQLFHNRSEVTAYLKRLP